MRHLALAAAAIVVAAPAFAEPSCEMPENRTPIWEAIKTFEEEGGEVVSFKINSGDCYEIYGRVEGVNMEIFFDPGTGEEIERIEA